MPDINPEAMAQYHSAAMRWETIRARWFTMQNNRKEALNCNVRIADHRSIHREMLLKIQKQKLEATA